ncbi:hypothetical protein R6Q59_007111 [Mikania micrantha]|uniref:O-methyltransferase domain-containing protein n=1 Tax=Mikania micrantha TaxID=192012 RepID=A0A5N6PY27_9ASTR|nr:hypothetical protein E3N88_00420 [Mikania micrantha]
MENRNAETRTSGTIVHSNETRLAILELANMISVPMALNAVVNLKVADSMWQNGSNTPLTASEIVSHIHPSGTADAENLQRILRMLTSFGVFNEHINAAERRYSLTDVGKTLVTDENGLSYGAYVLQHHQDPLMKAWPNVHEAVLDSSTEPFVKANGMSAYDMYGENPEMNDLMQKAMSGVSVPFLNAILETYDGFDGLERLVDVGGSSGESLKMIIEKHPKIKEAINFDLPEVVARAPEIDGVTHVGGDMFACVPKGDAIFMKWILTTWTDDEVKQILNNCFKAIPDGGKVIACEPVLPHNTDDTHRTRALLEGDIFVMTIYRAKGYHRTEEEYSKLGKLTGFTSFRAIYIDYFWTILEYKK